MLHRYAQAARKGGLVVVPVMQVQGQRPDERADIYSLGVMLFEMLTGKRPFDGDSAVTIMMKHVNDPVPDVRELNHDVPPPLVRVVEMALAKEPAERFQTAAGMATALRAIRLGAPAPVEPGATVVEPPVEEAPVLEATVVEPSALELAAAPPVAPELETGKAETPTTAPPPAVPPPAPAEKEKSRAPLIVVAVVAIVGIICVVGGGIFAVSRFFGGDAGAALPTDAVAAPVPTELVEPTELVPEEVTEAALPTPTEPEPSATPAPIEAEPTVTLSPPTETPAQAETPLPTETPTPTESAGPFVRINSITLESERYIVAYETIEYQEALPGMHVHFFFNTVPPEAAGVPGAGPWYLWGGPRPFDGYTVADRPAYATQMCALVANADHSIQAGSGNCVNLP